MNKQVNYLFSFSVQNIDFPNIQMQPIKLDDDSEEKVVRIVLKLQEDKNGEVQNHAIKCLKTLVDKVEENSVETIVDIQCSYETPAKLIPKCLSTICSWKSYPNPDVISFRRSIDPIPRDHFKRTTCRKPLSLYPIS
jgi:hypothetical protein